MENEYIGERNWNDNRMAYRINKEAQIYWSKNWVKEVTFENVCSAWVEDRPPTPPDICWLAPNLNTIHALVSLLPQNNISLQLYNMENEIG